MRDANTIYMLGPRRSCLAWAFVLLAVSKVIGQPIDAQILETIEQEWDSTAWSNVSRVERLLDVDGTRIGFLRYSWTGTDWAPIEGQRTLPEEDGQMQWAETQTWEDGDWEPKRREYSELNSIGLVVKEIQQEWNGVEWTNDFRRLFGYDGENQVADTTQSWDGSSWRDSITTAREYDGHGRLNLQEVLSHSENTTQNVRRLTIAYFSEANGENVEDRIVQVGSGPDWLNQSRSIQVTDAEGRRLRDVEMTWINDEWRNVDRILFAYDASGNQIERIRYKWPSGATDWIPDTYIYHTYDVQNRVTSRLGGVWTDGVQEDRDRSTYRYDPSGLRTDIDREQRLNGEWVWDSTQWFLFDEFGNEIEEGVGVWDGSEFVNSRRTLNSYRISTSQDTDVFPDRSALKLSSYPNPFRDRVEIRYELENSGQVNISIVDILGRIVAVIYDDEQTSGNHVAHWSGRLSAGVYFLRLTTEYGGTSRSVVSLE